MTMENLVFLGFWTAYSIAASKVSNAQTRNDRSGSGIWTAMLVVLAYLLWASTPDVRNAWDQKIYSDLLFNLICTVAAWITARLVLQEIAGPKAVAEPAENDGQATGGSIIETSNVHDPPNETRSIATEVNNPRSTPGEAPEGVENAANMRAVQSVEVVSIAELPPTIVAVISDALLMATDGAWEVVGDVPSADEPLATGREAYSELMLEQVDVHEEDSN